MGVDSIARLQRIQAELDSTGLVKVPQLAAELGVSEMTVRRDLDTLVDHGVATRVRGGAMARGPQPFAERFGRQARAKSRIAEKLLTIVGDGGAIGIDASSTVQRLAAALDTVRDLTVLTNSVDSFAVLGAHPAVTALITGGRLDPRTGSLVGPMATRSIGDVTLRRLFVSAAGIDPRFGTTESTLEEAEVKLALAEAARSIVVAIDSSKLGQPGSARCIPLDRIDILVTELAPSDALLDPYRGACEIL